MAQIFFTKLSIYYLSFFIQGQYLDRRLLFKDLLALIVSMQQRAVMIYVVQSTILVKCSLTMPLSLM